MVTRFRTFATFALLMAAALLCVGWMLPHRRLHFRSTGCGGGSGDAYTKLLLHFNCTGNAFTDSGPGAHTMTAVGNVTQSATQYKYGGKSGYFDGDGDYITTPNGSDFTFSGDLTIEMWVYPLAHTNSYPCLFGNYSTFGSGSLGIFAGHNSGSSTKYNVAFNGSFPVLTSTSNIQYDTWTHIAVVRYEGQFKLYVNGTYEAYHNSSATVTGGDTIYIGVAGDTPSDSEFDGYIDEYHISNTARWTADFTPPTEY